MNKLHKTVNVHRNTKYKNNFGDNDICRIAGTIMLFSGSDM